MTDTPQSDSEFRAWVRSALVRESIPDVDDALNGHGEGANVHALRRGWRQGIIALTEGGQA